MEKNEAAVTNLFDLRHTLAAKFLKGFVYPWEGLPTLASFVYALGASLEGFEEREEGVFVHPTATISPTALLFSPCVVGAGTEVRHGALLRGGTLVGEGCVIGNSSEGKNCILFDGAQIPHFNYVGDSILGKGAHLGAGAICSNLKGDRSPVAIHFSDGTVQTGLRKCGAFLGDGAEAGCGTVFNPGSVLGRGARTYPLLSVRGTHSSGTLLKE